jgi:hypothetical protein
MIVDDTPSPLFHKVVLDLPVPPKGAMDLDLNRYPGAFMAVLLQAAPDRKAIACIPLSGRIPMTTHDLDVAYESKGPNNLRIHNSSEEVRHFEIHILHS